MTGTEVEVVGNGTPAVPAGVQAGAYDDDLMVGLDEFGPEDYIMPRINIVQKEGVFQDNLSKEKFDSLTTVILGLHKGRVLWEPEPPEGKAFPLCKSNDHKTGYVNIKTFPWDASGFDPADYDEEQPILECANCTLKDWGSNPKGDTPWCTEQYTLILLVPFEGGYGPATLSLQRSNLSPIKAFLSSFKNKRMPTMVQETILTLELKKRGTTEYSNIQFEAGEATDPSMYGGFADQFRGIRDQLSLPPSLIEEDDSSSGGSSSSTPPKSAAKPGTATGAPAQPEETEPIVAEDDEEIPF